MINQLGAATAASGLVFALSACSEGVQTEGMANACRDYHGIGFWGDWSAEASFSEPLGQDRYRVTVVNESGTPVAVCRVAARNDKYIVRPTW